MLMVVVASQFTTLKQGEQMDSDIALAVVVAIVVFAVLEFIVLWYCDWRNKRGK